MSEGKIKSNSGGGGGSVTNDLYLKKDQDALSTNRETLTGQPNYAGQVTSNTLAYIQAYICTILKIPITPNNLNVVAQTYEYRLRRYYWRYTVIGGAYTELSTTPVSSVYPYGGHTGDTIEFYKKIAATTTYNPGGDTQIWIVDITSGTPAVLWVQLDQAANIGNYNFSSLVYGGDPYYIDIEITEGIQYKEISSATWIDMPPIADLLTGAIKMWDNLDGVGATFVNATSFTFDGGQTERIKYNHSLFRCNTQQISVTFNPATDEVNIIPADHHPVAGDIVFFAQGTLPITMSLMTYYMVGAIVVDAFTLTDLQGIPISFGADAGSNIYIQFIKTGYSYGVVDNNNGTVSCVIVSDYDLEATDTDISLTNIKQIEDYEKTFCVQDNPLVASVNPIGNSYIFYTTVYFLGCSAFLYVPASNPAAKVAFNFYNDVYLYSYTSPLDFGVGSGLINQIPDNKLVYDTLYLVLSASNGATKAEILTASCIIVPIEIFMNI